MPHNLALHYAHLLHIVYANVNNETSTPHAAKTLPTHNNNMELSSPNVSSNTVLYNGNDTPSSPKASYDYSADSSLFITYPSQAPDTSNLVRLSPEHSQRTRHSPKNYPHSIVTQSPFGTTEVKLAFPPTPTQSPNLEQEDSEASQAESPSPNNPVKIFSHTLQSACCSEPLSVEEVNLTEIAIKHPGEDNISIHNKSVSGAFLEMDAKDNNLSQKDTLNDIQHQNPDSQLNLDLYPEKQFSMDSTARVSAKYTMTEDDKTRLKFRDRYHEIPFNELETSFTSLPSSPMRKRYTNSRSLSISSHSDETNFQDSAFFNNTRARFDFDIDLDDHKLTGKIKSSPWQKTQSGIQHNQIFSSGRITTQGSIAEVSSASKIEELSKQLTDCRVQLKLYEKFLQDLIDSDRVDVNHLADFQEHFDDKANGFSKLEQEHAEICNLVEDLYSSLEEYQLKWKEADTRAQNAEQSLEDACLTLHQLTKILNVKCEAPIENPDLFISQAAKAIAAKIEKILHEREEAGKDLKENVQRHDEPEEKNLEVAEYLLREKIAEAEGWKNESINARHDLESLRLERDNSTERRLQDYQNKIDKLQREVENLSDPTKKDSFTDLSDISSSSNREREKYLLLQRDYENLQRVSHEKIEELRQMREEYENKLAAMNGNLSNRKRELINLRAELADTEGLQRDLETSVGKQRLLKSENLQLSWQLDSLNKDKILLQKRVDELNSKITERLPEMMVETHFKSLLDADIRRFEKVYNSLDLLAEEASLREPEQKIKRLTKLSQELTHVYKPGDINTIKRDHKYVFDYFVRAIDAMVKEHIRILLESSENEAERQLKEKILELEGTNAQLRANQLKNSEEEVSILKLRNQQLHEKWKYEREQRVHDNFQSKDRFEELEEEIRELRKKLR